MTDQALFTDEHELFRDNVRRFIEREITPFHDQWEKDGMVPRSLWRKAGDAGLLCPTLPEDYGGAGADFRYSAILIEELARTNASGPGFALHSDIVVPYIQHYGSEAQKRRWLPKLASGETIGAIAMTEPGAGSDLQGVRTTATVDGNEIVVSGQKTFISNGQLADLVIVVAKTDAEKGAHGTSLIVVEADRDGFSRGRNLEKAGLKAQDTSELFFDSVRVPPDNILGPEGDGFKQLMEQLPQERLIIGLGAIASAEAALGWTIDYVKERKAFGKPIVAFQNTRFTLADLKTDVTVGRVFADHCLRLHLDGALDVTMAAMCKLHLSELQWRVLDACVQLHGGYGYMWEYPVTKAWADARVQRIYGGTSEIMKELIGRAL